jgi:hypothetical protein
MVLWRRRTHRKLPADLQQQNTAMIQQLSYFANRVFHSSHKYANEMLNRQLLHWVMPGLLCHLFQQSVFCSTTLHINQHLKSTLEHMNSSTDNSCI